MLVLSNHPELVSGSPLD